MAIAGARAEDDNTLLYIALGWWVVSVVIGLWLGRGAGPARHRALLADGAPPPRCPRSSRARCLQPALGGAAVTVVAGAVRSSSRTCPRLPRASGCWWPLAWRKQSSAVQAIEERDGVRFYVERDLALQADALLRTPG